MEDNKVLDVVDSEANEREYVKALEVLSSYKLKWTLRSVDYVVNTQNISLGQLRSAVYVVDGYPVFNFVRATIDLIKAGLIGSKQYKETDDEDMIERAYEIMEDWMDNGWFIGTLHLLIINQMETKHFFMGMRDLVVTSHLSSKNLQTDLVSNLINADIEDKVKQTQAYTSAI